MKKILYYSTLICVLAVTACSNSKKSSTLMESKSELSQAITDQKWQLTALSGKPVADKINGKVPFLLLQTEGSRYSASGGCNGLGGTYTLSAKNGIKFSLGMSTMMACEDMTAESGLNKVMLEADGYTLNAGLLTLNKGKTSLAQFKAVESVDATALNGTWEVNYISGPRIAFEGLYPGKKPTITFNVAELKANGNSSCNNYNIGFTIDGSNIKFGDPMSTKMACEGMGEATFFKTLKTVSKFGVNDNTLNLIMGDIAVMRLERK